MRIFLSILVLAMAAECARVAKVYSLKKEKLERSPRKLALRPKILLAQKKAPDFQTFKDRFAQKFKIDKKLMDLDEVKKWYKKEFIQGNKKLDLDNTAQMASVSASLGNIWCSYCQSISHCSCIKQWCNVSTC